MNLRRNAGPDPWSTICPELVVLNVSGHLTGANQHSGPGILPPLTQRVGRRQATSGKLQATSLTKKNKGL